MELTARMRAILSALLAADGYVPAERIASALDVSARTITREMHGLEMALMPYGITLLRRTGAGFMLTGDKADLTRLRTQISKVNVRGELTPDQRRSILVTRLLMADEPLKLFARTPSRTRRLRRGNGARDSQRARPQYSRTCGRGGAPCPHRRRCRHAGRGAGGGACSARPRRT